MTGIEAIGHEVRRRRGAMSADNLLLVADSERDAEYALCGRMFVADPFIYFRAQGNTAGRSRTDRAGTAVSSR